MLKQIAMAIVFSSFFTIASVPVLAHEGEVHCEDTELGSIMKDMNDDLKAYVKAFKRNDKMAMQVQLLKLLANTKKSKEELPLKLKQKQQTVQQREMAEVTHEHAHDHQHDKAALDHSTMAKIPGMDRQTHRQYMEYQQGLDKLTHLLQQLQTAPSKTEIKTLLNSIKQHTKKSHREYQLECE